MSKTDYCQLKMKVSVSGQLMTNEMITAVVPDQSEAGRGGVSVQCTIPVTGEGM